MNLSPSAIEARRKGGLAIAARGSAYMSQIGRKGGRPKARTIDEVVADIRTQISERGESLSDLKEAWKLRLVERQLQGAMK